MFTLPDKFKGTTKKHEGYSLLLAERSTVAKGQT